MDFSEQYLTYGEYKALGGTLDIMPFNLLEFNARKKIDERTLGRLSGVKEIPQEVKLCVFEMIKVLNSYDTYTTQNKAVASENIDGYSISYTGANSNNTSAKNNELEDVIDTYLTDVVVDGTPVLYLGVC